LANDFISSLQEVKQLLESNYTRKVNTQVINKLVKKYRNSKKRIIFLDNDGTLTGFHNNPQMAMPDAELYAIMKKLTSNKKNTIVVISGRDQETLSKWFKEYYNNLAFIAEHGVCNKNPGAEWSINS
jgi:trehalose 6-phosphate synthase/phosphatase